MKIVIAAPDSDNHTAPLKWALEQAGYQVICWAGLGWSPERQAAITFSKETLMTLGDYTLQPGDVLWIRRPEQPKHNPNVSEFDRKFAEGEYRWFGHSIMYLWELLPIRCINKYSASRFINNKAVQLLLAEECGMKVPHALLSNSPSAVRSYMQQHSERMICKAFFPHIWQKQNSEALVVTETFEIDQQTLPSDEVLTYAPAIYQEMVVKEFDVRMVLLGTTVYSFALHNPKGAIDWRQDVAQGIVKVESIETPPDVEKAVLAFARKAGISFGSLDFAVDSHGQWWFFEINEQGQFLWLDAHNDNNRIQEKFLAFLTSPEGASRQTIEERQSLFPSWKDYIASPAKDLQLPEKPEKPGEDRAFVSTEP